MIGAVITLLYIGKSSVPQVFFNGRLIGGAEELQRLEDEGRLDAMITACSDAPDADFPPPLRLPKPAEFLEVHLTYIHSRVYSTVGTIIIMIIILFVAHSSRVETEMAEGARSY